MMEKYITYYNLSFDPKYCTGCGTCESVCPKNAIKVKRNGKRFTVEINNSCTSCGICSDLCPYGALRGKESVYKEFLDENEFKKVRVDESLCIFCGLCMRECPRGAIKVLRKIDKKMLRRGTFRIKDNCIDCKLCVEICPTKAISIYKSKPFIDLEKCIFCEMCSRICPMNVLDVRCDSCRNINDKKFAVSGKIVIDEKICSSCGICAEVCPKNAIKVSKIFLGEQKWFKDRCSLECFVCRDVCPNSAISYRYEPDKLVVFNGRCNFCGACERFCPRNAIKISRKIPVDLKIDFKDVRRERTVKIRLKNGCIGCGICTSICTEKREILEIVNGSLVEKVTNDCTACGLCAYNCPIESLEISEN